jgi:endonuclease/exonuclease/phosphatase family metal-dependent hydrolase
MKTIILTLALLLAGCSTFHEVNGPAAALPDQTSIKVLTLNLKADDSQPREARLEPVVAACKAQGVDILLLQEGASGVSETDNIDLLRAKLGYPSMIEAPVFGVYPFKLNNVGIISRYPWLETNSSACEVQVVEKIDQLPIPGKRRVIMGQVYIPGLGQVYAYSVHLASSPTNQEERNKQVACMLEFIDSRPGGVLEILGGDFNFGEDNPAYQMIIRAGFKGVGSAPDFIFVRGAGEIIDWHPEFTDHFVSDHVGVVATIR